MENLCEDVILMIISKLSAKDIARLHYSYCSNYSFICRLEKCIQEIDVDICPEYKKIYEQENYSEDYYFDDDFYIWDTYFIEDI